MYIVHVCPIRALGWIRIGCGKVPSKDWLWKIFLLNLLVHKIMYNVHVQVHVHDNIVLIDAHAHVCAYLSLEAFVRSRQYTSVVTSNKTYTQQHKRCYTN